jgi:hypothetical protein
MYEQAFSKLPSVDLDHQIHLNRYIKFISSRPERKFKLKQGLCRHHVQPVSFGANKSYTQNYWNIIVLTNREHFIAHLLLWKTYGKEMAQAFFLMNSRDNNLTSRQYDTLVKETVLYKSKKMKGCKSPMKGKHHTEEANEKNRQAHLGVNTFYLMTEEAIKEHNRKLSESKMGHTMSESSRKKSSDSHKGQVSGMKGKHFTEKTRKRMSESRKNRHMGKDNPTSRKVRCVETQEVFNSIKEVGRLKNISTGHISDCCRGIRNTTQGFHWEYYD